MITAASRSSRCATYRVPSPGPTRCWWRSAPPASIPARRRSVRAASATSFPTFPSGEGSDLAGVVEEIGSRVNGVAVGDEVIGYTDNRASHAECVLVEASNLTAKPANVPWEVAGALFVAGVTGVATVRTVAPARSRNWTSGRFGSSP